jgi:hypothetical protein
VVPVHRAGRCCSAEVVRWASSPDFSCAQQNREVTSDEVIVLFVLVVACRWKSGPGSCQEAR